MCVIVFYPCSLPLCQPTVRREACLGIYRLCFGHMDSDGACNAGIAFFVPVLSRLKLMLPHVVSHMRMCHSPSQVFTLIFMYFFLYIYIYCKYAPYFQKVCIFFMKGYLLRKNDYEKNTRNLKFCYMHQYSLVAPVARKSHQLIFFGTLAGWQK